MAGNLEAPWEVAFLPDGRMLVTERPGRLRVIADGRLQPEPVLTLPVYAAPGIESGLLGLAVHPRYPQPAFVYLYYTYRGAQGAINRLSRFEAQAGGGAGLQLVNERGLLDGIPGGVCCHFGGRIHFGPDGMLYVTVGDGQQPDRAADRASLNGKILRLRDDGSNPPDNPFPDSPVFAFGLRNSLGIAWDNAGRLYASDNGPTGDLGLCCHDRVDLIEPGRFYGWPLLAGHLPTRHSAIPGLPAPVPPLVETGDDTWAPAGMSFYAPRRNERPTLLLTTLRGQTLRRIVFSADDPRRVVTQEVVLSGLGRLREAIPGPDGCLYLLTSNRDGRGQPANDDDRLLRACTAA